MTSLQKLTNDELVAAFQALVGSLRTMIGKVDTGAVNALCDAIQHVCVEAKARGISLAAA